ncbi:SWIM zinc finger family protein [Halobacterium sp. CBA1126]|uniref:SWIM zinc finger family protein n=1 Tax=Halobacterium TaxID=2239 RepID=UPI0012F7E487|nr:SWIM zinc finger family protein [Halobacterium sp. CBA1126]MUV61557.1 SWIM zinc finger family protein [Halobacterium sp. CBA1126]
MAPTTTRREQPDERSRRARREELRVTARGDGTYDVHSPSGNVYAVDLDAGECACPDHQFRGARCKHLRRVAIDVTLGDVPAPGERATACAACDAGLFAGRDTADPVYCEDCTLEAGETVVDRETGDLVVVVESTDDRASDVPVAGRGWSVADHHSNRDYDPDDRVVDALYPLDRGVSPDEISPRDRRRYSFPRGRLERRG